MLLEIIYPRIPGVSPPQEFLQTAQPEQILSLYAKYLVSLCMWTAGIIALGVLIYAGILYLLSTGKPEKMISAKNQITGALLGLLILLSSYIILAAINPNLTDLTLPGLTEFEITKPPKVDLPETAAETSIDVEIPFGRIIESIFETHISDYPDPETQRTPRMTKIINNLISSQQIVNKLLQQSNDLYEASEECECENTSPTPCCGQGVPESQCGGKNSFSCRPGCENCPPPSCTCDPCQESRDDIQKNEKNNQIDLLALAVQQKTTEQEIRLLDEELNKLERAEKAIEECPLRKLSSWKEFSAKGDLFRKQGDTLRKINFWDDININYYTGKQTQIREIATDYATFYCTVGGTFEQQITYSEPDESSLTGDESIEEAETVFSESGACAYEAPVGEIIDRAKRITRLLIDKLEEIIAQEKRLASAIDALQILISQCTSVPCRPQCICTMCGEEPCCCGFGGCRMPPCDKGALSRQIGQIQEISNEITRIIGTEEGLNNGFGEGQEITPQQITIRQIIGVMGPEIISELEVETRESLRTYEMTNCNQVLGSIIPPDNRMLKICCKAYNINSSGQTEQTPFGDCLEECYLKTSRNDYRQCVESCLLREGRARNDEDLPLCIHKLNFYACQED